MPLYRRPNSPFWWSKLYVNGKPHYFSTRQRNKSAALSFERAEAERLEKQAKREGHYSLATMSAAWVESKEAARTRDLTIKRFRSSLTVHILPFFGADRDVRTVGPADLEAFRTLRSKQAAAPTVGQDLTVLRQVLRFCAEVHGLMLTAPTVRNPRRRYEPKWRLLTPDELARLLVALANRDNRGREALPWALLVASTGMRMGRSGEVARLRWDMVDLEKRIIRIPGEITKTGRPRNVHLNDTAIEGLRMVHRSNAVGEVFRDKQHYQSWHAACQEAGIGYARPYDLRHTFASLLHASGRPLVQIRDLLGHTTWTMMNHYAHAFEEGLREAAQSVALPVPVRPPPRRIRKTIK